MAKNDSGWQDWEKADKYRPDDDNWGEKSRSDARWTAWDRKAADADDGTREAGDEMGAGSGRRRGAGRTKDQSWQEAYREAGPFLDIGLNLAITIVSALVVFLLGGSWLDKRLGLEPVLTITGAVLAFVAIFYRFYAGVKRLTKMETAKRVKPESDRVDS